MKKLIHTCFLILSVSAVMSQTREPIKQNLVFKIDSMGNANIEISSKLNAMQWQAWENAYGGKNISRFKRDIERTLNSMFLYDFDYKENEMDRAWSLNFKAKGVARYLGNNKWVAEIGIKNPDFSKLSNNSYLVTSTSDEDGILTQQNNTIFFPVKASNIQEDKDEFGLAIFNYNLKPVTNRSSLILTIGLIFVGAAIALAGYILLKSRSIQPLKIE
ncbi:MAG: hypothetical protein U1C46_07295 [Bacteroidales bacterium]|nr:hypothetical protein [Bacteroidales bacterium]MDZ4204608.1 hypothetical protein [Bacteroidales bacterium]